MTDILDDLAFMNTLLNIQPANTPVSKITMKISAIKLLINLAAPVSEKRLPGKTAAARIHVPRLNLMNMMHPVIQSAVHALFCFLFWILTKHASNLL